MKKSSVSAQLRKITRLAEQFDLGDVPAVVEIQPVNSCPPYKSSWICFVDRETVEALETAATIQINDYSVPDGYVWFTAYGRTLDETLALLLKQMRDTLRNVEKRVLREHHKKAN